VTSPRSVDTAGLLVCTVALQEIQTATAAEVDEPSPRVERARPRRNNGNQRGRATRNTAVSNDPSNRDTSTQSLRDDFGWDPDTGEVI